MKLALMTAAFALTMVSPAIAEETAGAKPERPHHERGEFREKMRAEGREMREGFKTERKEMFGEHKAEAHAAREECHKRMKAAEGPEAKDAILKECRAKADDMRNSFRKDKDELIAERREQVDDRRIEIRKKHEEMKANHQERRKVFGKPAE